MRKIPILMFHNISSPPRGKRLTSLYTHPASFHRQMSTLSHLGYKGLSLQELQPYLRGEKSEKVFGITFDDGYLDNYCNALPVLKKFAFSATCYLVSGFIGKQNDWTRNQNVQECDLMDTIHVRKWLQEGMAIGSHSHTHAHLCQIPAERLENEIFHSKILLENTFQIPIEDFCFPYGEFSPQTLALLKKANYKTGVTTQRGRASQTDDIFALPRVHMTKRTNLALLLMKVLTPYEDHRRRVSGL